MLFISFTLLILIQGTVGRNRRERAAGGIPGPPGYKARPKGGPDTPYIADSDLTASAPATLSAPIPSSAAIPPSVAIPPSAAIPASAVTATTDFAPSPASTQASTSSITIFPTSSSTSSSMFTLTSSLEPKEYTLTSTSTTISLIPSTLPSAPLVTPTVTPSSIGSSFPTTNTLSPWEWSTTTSMTIISTPTSLNITATEQSPKKRNLTIILSTLLTTAAFSAVAFVFFLTRCFTRRPFFSIPCLHTRALTPDEDIQPLRPGEASVTEKELPGTTQPSTEITRFSIKRTTSLHPYTSLSTQTRIPLSSTTPITPLAPPKVALGLTLPSVPDTPPPPRLSPFPPLRPPPTLGGSPRQSQSFSLQSQSHRSHVSSMMSTRSKSQPGTPRSIESGLLAETRPARYTFGDDFVGQWTLGEGRRGSTGTENRRSEVSAPPPHSNRTFDIGEAV